jgi:hypothetical protein
MSNINHSDRSYCRVEDVEDRKEHLKRMGPMDDILVFQAIQSRLTFPAASKYGNWSAKWTGSDLQARWHAMIYDEETAESAAKAIAGFSEKKRRTKWTESELKLMERAADANFEGFAALFEQNRQVWHPMRTLNMVASQARQVARSVASTAAVAESAPEHATLASKSSIRAKPNPSKTPSAATTATTSSSKRKSSTVSNSTSSDPTSTSTPHIIPEETSSEPHPIETYRWTDHPGVLGVVHGEKIVFEVKEFPVIIGRKAVAAPTEQVLHINLSDEGDASKISRSQAVINIHSSKKYMTLEQLGKAMTTIDDQSIKDQGAVHLPERCSLGFSNLTLEWMERPHDMP